MMSGCEGDTALVLVVGIGGGSDAQMAFAVAQALQEGAQQEGTCAAHYDWVDAKLAARLDGREVCCVYGTAKWRNPDEQALPRVHSVPEASHDFEFLNEKMPSGAPRWVGTTLMEETIPHSSCTFTSVVTRKEKTLTSPVVFKLDKPNNQGVHESEPSKEDIDAALSALDPEKGWTAVIAVDSGGDVLGGVEDSRDLIMLLVLKRLCERQHQEQPGLPSPEFRLNICGLCIDGENYFLQMERKLLRLRARNALLGCTSIAVLKRHLEKVVSIMERTKTPRVMLDALNGLLAQVPESELIRDFVYNDDGKLEEIAQNAIRVASKLKMLDWVSVSSPADRFFISLPQRHFRLKDGSNPPQVIVPVAWATRMFVFAADEVVKEIFSFGER